MAKVPYVGCSVVAFCVAAVLALPLCFAAESYPVKPVRVLAGGAAGGPIDIMARVVGQKLGDVLGQTIVIDKAGVVVKVFNSQFDIDAHVSEALSALKAVA